MSAAQLSLAIACGFAVFSFWAGFLGAKLQRLIEAIDRANDGREESLQRVEGAIDDFRAAVNTHALRALEDGRCESTHGPIRTDHGTHDVRCTRPANHKGDHTAEHIRWVDLPSSQK